MARKRKPKPPIDRAFLREFLARAERHGRALPVTQEAIDRWARKHLDGKTRDEQERAICGPWLVFLTEELRQAVGRMMALRAGRNPSEN